MSVEPWDHLLGQPPPSVFLAGLPELITEVEVKWVFPMPLLSPSKAAPIGNVSAMQECGDGYLV